MPGAAGGRGGGGLLVEGGGRGALGRGQYGYEERGRLACSLLGMRRRGRGLGEEEEVFGLGCFLGLGPDVFLGLGLRFFGGDFLS